MIVFFSEEKALNVVAESRLNLLNNKLASSHVSKNIMKQCILYINGVFRFVKNKDHGVAIILLKRISGQ